MTFNSDLEDDVADTEEDHRERELLETVRARSVETNVKLAYDMAAINWHRHGDEALEELRVILSVLQELASKPAKPKAPLTVAWAKLSSGATEALAGVYTEAEVAEDLAYFRKLLTGDETSVEPKTVLPKTTRFAEVRDVFLSVFGEIEESRLKRLVVVLASATMPAGTSA